MPTTLYPYLIGKTWVFDDPELVQDYRIPVGAG
jgi:hypothetical protein